MLSKVGVDLAAAEMPQVDHRVGQGFERVVQFADALEAQQQATELVFPGEDPLDGAKALFEDGGIEERLAPASGFLPAAGIGVDVGRHAAIEDGLAVGPAVVDAVQADDAAVQGEADGTGHARELRRFVAVARCGHERRDHIAVAVAESDDLVALDLLVAAETEVVAALLGGRRRAVAVDDIGVEQMRDMQGGDRASEDPVKTALRLPMPKHPVNARVMNFRAAVQACGNGQFLPVTAQVQQPQDIVEDGMQIALQALLGRLCKIINLFENAIE